MTRNDHFETQKSHFWAFLASFKISVSSLQHPRYMVFDIFWRLRNIVKVKHSFFIVQPAPEHAVTYRQSSLLIRFKKFYSIWLNGCTILVRYFTRNPIKTLDCGKPHQWNPAVPFRLWRIIYSSIILFCHVNPIL